MSRTMSLPEVTTTEEINETWKVPNIQQYISKIWGKFGDRPDLQRPIPDSSITSHIFNIGNNSESKDKQCLQAQAFLADYYSDLVLKISLQDRRQTPHWGVKVKFISVSCGDAALGPFCVLTNRSNNYSAYEESNLRTSNCIAFLFQGHVATQYTNPDDNSMTIRFSLTCKITKPAMSIKPEVELPIAKETDFQICEFQAFNDFKALLNDPTTSDFKITTTFGDCQSFDCHKSILAARSSVFRVMFETKMKETQENEVTVEDISAEAMEHFLSFLYSGRFQKESWIRYLPQLTNAAEKYCVSSLKQVCDTNLIKIVTCENALAIADLAQRHQLPNAILDVRNFIEKNARNLNLDFAVATKALEI